MIKVLLVDDSAMVRHALTLALKEDPDLEVVGAAPDPYVARDLILSLHPDVLVLDIEMPRMDGLTFLRRLMHSYPLPVIIFSSLAPAGSVLALEALEIGAIDVVAKPEVAYSMGAMGPILIERIRVAARVDVKRRLRRGQANTPRPSLQAVARLSHQVVAIGASTGGTEALRVVLEALPATTPGLLITQHMPAQFTRSFANRLNGLCRVEVREARDGDAVAPGIALIAPGDYHLLLARDGARMVVALKKGPLVNRHRPSVDVMFRSVAEAAGKNAVGVILTGMGADGAEAMLEMKRAGAATIAQDEKSCVVFGMPRVAIELGGVDEVVALQKIPERIIALCQRRNI